jgi:hypothetical protein
MPLNSSSLANTYSMSSLNPVKQLVEQAAEQKHVNYHLCVFHYQLIRILFFIMKFNIKPTRPFAYFDTKVLKNYLLKAACLEGFFSGQTYVFLRATHASFDYERSRH